MSPSSGSTQSTSRGIRRRYPEHVPAVQRRDLWAWVLFDSANSGYTTVVITAVFSACFVSAIAGNAN